MKASSFQGAGHVPGAKDKATFSSNPTATWSDAAGRVRHQTQISWGTNAQVNPGRTSVCDGDLSGGPTQMTFAQTYWIMFVPINTLTRNCNSPDFRKGVWSLLGLNLLRVGWDNNVIGHTWATAALWFPLLECVEVTLMLERSGHRDALCCKTTAQGACLWLYCLPSHLSSSLLACKRSFQPLH